MNSSQLEADINLHDFLCAIIWRKARERQISIGNEEEGVCIEKEEDR